MRRCLPCILLLLVPAASLGCHDGPMYALKRVNPYFQRQWAADEKLGVTDHQRMQNLRLLTASIHRMPAAEQASWTAHLQSVLEQDPSAEMRFQAVRTLQHVPGDAALQLIAGSLEDESVKVRMAACDVLGSRSEPQAAHLLAETVNSSVDADVRLAAVAALRGHRGAIVNDALKMTLESNDPALRHAAIESLRTITGQDLGNETEPWLAYLAGNPVTTTAQQAPLGQRLRELF